ncbi:hypothetical protein Lser_V15G15257 [Lactuca serriola]
MTISRGATTDLLYIGVILFELLLAIPPFNEESPQIREFFS